MTGASFEQEPICFTGRLAADLGSVSDAAASTTTG